MNQSIKVEKTVMIDKHAAELYRFWHHFENLPRFTKHLQDVKVTNDKRSHWITRGPLDRTIEWDAEIIEDRENELIAWTSVGEADVDNSGSVRFKPASGNRGTEVKVITTYTRLLEQLEMRSPNSLAKTQNSRLAMISPASKC